MRDWIFAGSVIAMLFGLGVGIVIRPEMSMLDDTVADLMFCEMDRDVAQAKATSSIALASRKTEERNRAVKHSDEWQGWYEDANRNGTALAAKLGAIQTELAAFRFAYEAKGLELASVKVEQARAVAAVVPIPKKVERKKKKRKALTKRKPAKIVYHWHLF